ncbi:MAG: NAD(P)-dependent oxidoreductase [Patescibacteria group bacterium]
MGRVVIMEPAGYSPRALASYATIGEVVQGPFATEEALRSALAEAEVIVIRLGKVPASLMEMAPKLRVIASPTTGIDHIDIPTAERRGIAIVCLKGKRDLLDKIYATSELTVTLILSLLRRIPAAHAHVTEGGWDRQRFIGTEVSGKTVGLIGCGRLGARVATILDAMGAKVIACDPYQPAEKIPACVTRLPLEEVLSVSDIVSVHVALSPETTRMIAEPQFALMKQGAFFINTSRGQVVDETALLHALESGHLTGAALDVMEGEDGDGRHLATNPLREYAKTHDRLILVPHIGGATHESMGLTEDAIAADVLTYLSSHVK